MMIQCSAKDVFLSAAPGRAPAKLLRPAPVAKGLNPNDYAAHTLGKIVKDQAAKAAMTPRLAC